MKSQQNRIELVTRPDYYQDEDEDYYDEEDDYYEEGNEMMDDGEYPMCQVCPHTNSFSL